MLIIKSFYKVFRIKKKFTPLFYLKEFTKHDFQNYFKILILKTEIIQIYFLELSL